MILFAISITAAAVAPERRGTQSTDEETTTSTDSIEPAPAGGSSSASIEASADDPETVRAGVGDQLELTISAQSLLQVEIAALGLLEPAEPGAPARFDLLLREPGELEITDAEDGAVIGRLLVSGPGSSAGGGPARDDGVAEPVTVEATDGEHSRNG